MKSIFKFVSLLFLALLFTNCEQELPIEHENSSANVTLGANSNIKRDRLKQRSNGIYKNLMVVSDPFGVVNSAEVQMLSTNGIAPTPQEFFPDLVNEGEGIKKFKFNQLNFENGTADGWPFKKVVTFRDTEGQPVGDPVVSWATAQDNDEVELLDISIKQNGPTGNYILRTKIQALDSTYSSTVTYYFSAINEEGLIEKDKTIGYNPSVRSINHKGVEGLSKEVEVIDYNDGDDLFNKINPETNTVGVVVEVRNEQGQLMDDDLFVVTIENTAPEGIAVKSTQHKVRANGNHKIKIKLEGTDVQEAAYVEVDLADGGRVRLLENGEIDFLFVSDPEPIETVSVGDSYMAPVIVFDSNDEPITILDAQFTVIDANSSATATPLFDELAAGESDSFQLRSITVPDLNGDGSAVIEASAYGTARIIPQDGGSEADPSIIDLTLVALEEHRAIFEGEVFFIEPDNVVDMEYVVEYTYYDAQGNEIGNVDVMLVGQENPHPTFTTCMSHGSAPNRFEYTVTTNEPAYQNTDVLYVNFGDGSGENLSPECSFPMFRDGANGDQITFKGVDIRFADLSRVDENSSIYFSLTPEGDEVSQISFINAESIHTLGFFNTETGEWECEDNCLDGADQCSRYGDYKNDSQGGVLTVHVCHL